VIHFCYELPKCLVSSFPLNVAWERKLKQQKLKFIFLCFAGKTIVLVIKGSQWLHQGRDVLVLTTVFSANSSPTGHAVSLLIERQLQQICDSLPPPKSLAARPTVTRVNIEAQFGDYSDSCYNFCWADEDMEKVASKAHDGKLFIIYDEAVIHGIG
jgi:hypothetical protein